MELIRGLNNLKAHHHGCVLTIGKFDGVHLGHQAVLDSVIKQARRLSLPATVMVFEPHPEEVFTPHSAPARISPLAEKYQLLKAQGVDRLLCVRFNAAFAAQSADTFIEQLLVQKLGVKFLVVGDDFRFGKGRTGDFDRLQQAGEKYGFELVSTQSYRMADCRISSTAVREALADGNFSLAHNMLGRAFFISGRVIHGEKKGRTIGFPTANVLLNRCQTPITGVFAVKLNIAGSYYTGVANIGSRPTVNGQRKQLEVHIFDFEGSLYGQRIQVMPVAKIRDEKRFDGLDALRQQIARDVEQAQQVLMNNDDLLQV
ncbi:bifunctional riboflavin kinase/FAD synthetase [Alteromonas gilva]|uniref:Riboflavin biosynthesis protein n=1 Tax=Alteromonas gilva TaxID=2987522 RepID=A0ABT5L6P0_9ALTE|nr:bifunctional riboflavin kinase/FAD synthetase [Alteromonas gilva]MDC8832730.1 bifunctional riboflavin kinase/FAD synthetase [Alteromonas gilva]